MCYQWTRVKAEKKYENEVSITGCKWNEDGNWKGIWIRMGMSMRIGMGMGIDACWFIMGNHRD